MLTFHKIIAGCEAGEADAWRAFLSDYSPVVREWTKVYTAIEAEQSSLWKRSLGKIAESDFAVLRSFEHQSEPEFLVGLRSFYLEQCLSAADSRPDDAASAINAPALSGLLKDVPLVHQEVIFLKLAGYANATLEKIYRITPSVAKSSLSRLEASYPAALENASGHGLYPAAWLTMLHEIRGSRTEACPPVRLLLRIQDGQVGWGEKSPAETHIAGCLHCLDQWTALREIAYLRRDTKPASSSQVEDLLAGLPVRETGKKHTPLIKRLFG